LARTVREFCLRSIAVKHAIKILLRGADILTSPPNEVMLRIFISTKILSSSAASESAKLESQAKHANHYTTEGNEIESGNMKQGCPLNTIELYQLSYFGPINVT
jgi:hypothetical protein